MKLAWNENWSTNIRKSKFAFLALSLGLALGYAGGQMINSHAETESKTKIQNSATTDLVTNDSASRDLSTKLSSTKSAEKVRVHSGTVSANGDPATSLSQADRLAEMNAAMKRMRASLFSMNPHSSLFCPWWMPYETDAVFRNLDLMSDIDSDWGMPLHMNTYMPKLNTTLHGDEVKLTAEVPGVETNNLDVTVNDDSITIKGEKKEEITEAKVGKNDKAPKVVERSFGSFERTVSLPCKVQSDKAQATLKNGVLTVVVPKSADNDTQGRKLSIRTE